MTARMPVSAFKEVAKRQRRSKYGAIRTTVDGITFDSAGEAKRYIELTAMERAGAIKSLRLQPAYILAPACVINGRKRPPMKYVGDFSYEENGVQIVEDFKGVRTDVYVLKRHLMMAIHGVAIRETGSRK